MKCDFCPDMACAGVLPFCVQGCPNNAIYYGDLEEDVASNGEEVVSFSRFLSENNVYPRKKTWAPSPGFTTFPDTEKQWGGTFSSTDANLPAGPGLKK